MKDVVMDNVIAERELRAKREAYLESLQLCVDGLHYVGWASLTTAYKMLISELVKKIEGIDEDLVMLGKKGEK